MKVFFHVQHLLGTGHLQRAATLCRALAAAGLEVTLASGGRPVPGIALEGVRLVQLPPAAAADASFKTLIDAEGRPLTDAWREERARRLLTAWRESKADAVVIELYPFGRRQMRFELEPLIAEARAARSLVLCSVRDLIQAKPEREAWMLDTFRRGFDRVLVHADPRVVRFEESFSRAAELGDRLFYTGYIVDATPLQGEAGRGEVIVSAGGGAVGARLLATALEARPLTSLRSLPWRLLAGPDAIGLKAPPGVTVEPPRRDFRTLLANCALSISQAGYNTVAETLQAGARAVLVPFAAGTEMEQTMRARRFAARGLVEMVEERELSPASLAAALERAARRERRSSGAVDLDGARASAALIREWLA